MQDYSVQWIKVESKLPENIREDWSEHLLSQEVLICYLENNRYKIKIAHFENGVWWSDEKIVAFKVDYWMKLPNLPL